MKLTKTYYLILLACTVSCGHFEPVEKEEFPPIWPDYTDVTIPANIAPMNFGPADSVNAYRISVTVSDGNGRVVLKSKGSVVRFPLHKWHRVLRDASGTHLSFLVEMKTADGWTRYKPFHMNVSSDPIDYGLTYRLIPLVTSRSDTWVSLSGIFPASAKRNCLTPVFWSPAVSIVTLRTVRIRNLQLPCKRQTLSYRNP